MSQNTKQTLWTSAGAYEPYVGRWSRLVAREFLEWLALPAGLKWLDIGCGTGALTQAILTLTDPANVTGLDRSEAFIDFARERLPDERATFKVGDAQSLPFDDASFDSAVSGLVLNFVPEPDKAVTEWLRVVRPSGNVAAYIWDYADKMEMMRYLWDGAVALNPDARALDEAVRCSICQPESLAELFIGAGLHDVEVRAIDAPTHFRDFDDYWSPFLGGHAPAPSYVMSLGEDDRAALREYVRGSLPIEADGSIKLIARAWAVRGKRP